MSLAAQIARSLEEGRGGPLAIAASTVWGAMAGRSLVKPLLFPSDKRVIVVGGGTLGGSGKTPLAIECARYLASIGERVALVGHAYGAMPPEPLVVSLRDHVACVGDEALVAARALVGCDVPVVVAPTRQAALDLALTRARVAVVDGVSQTSPVRAHLALLSVDALQPWGSGMCPPHGDLRAPREALVSACDRIVAVGDDATLSYDLSPYDRPIHQVRTVSDGAWLDGVRLGWGEIRRHKVAVWTAIARPGRVMDQLAKVRVVPKLAIHVPDHGIASTSETTRRAQRALEAGVDLWLCTAKCAVHLPPQVDGIPLAVIDYRLRLGDGFRTALRAAVGV
jgi:tetraacyldisaccharide 4'-kinase